MARVGRFGRNRRMGASNLTQLIANLMREQRQAEDRAAFDAWQNGGEFKGKPMTDERIVGYIKGRRNGFSTDDPLWDQWNNTLVQTRFGIGEQKIGLAFKQGKVSAGAVAGWYRKQLSSIPKESQFYRTVAGRAADWAKSAAASARGSGRASAYKGAQNKKDRLDGIISKTDGLTAAIEMEAKRRGVIGRDGSIWNADASNLEAMFAQGVTINGRVISLADWRQSSVRGYNAQSQMRDVYKAFGWDTSGLLSRQQQALSKLTVINAIDDRAKYEGARELWLERVAAAEGDPYAIDKINAEYVKALGGILDRAQAAGGKQENEAAFIGGLVNEMNAITTGKNSGPTVADSFDIERGDAESSAASALQNRTNMELLASGQAVLGQQEPGGAYAVLTDPAGDLGKDPAMQRTVVNINGTMREVYLRGAPITSGMLLDPTGKPVPVEEMTQSVQRYQDQGYTYEPDGKTVGYKFTTGKGEVNYGVYDANGQLQYTSENPFASSYPTSDGGLIVVGTPTGDPNNPTIDPASIYLPNTPAFTPVPVVQGATPDTLASYFLGTGDEADAATAKALTDRYGTPGHATLGVNGQMSDSQMIPRARTTGGTFGTPTADEGTSLVRDALRATMGSIQDGMAPLFGGRVSGGTFGSPPSTPSGQWPPNGANPWVPPAPAPPKPKPPAAAPTPPPPKPPAPTPPNVNTSTGFTLPPPPSGGGGGGGGAGTYIR